MKRRVGSANAKMIKRKKNGGWREKTVKSLKKKANDKYHN